MTKAIAYVALTIIAVILMFCQYWFTFGIWPKSWVSFITIATAQIILGFCFEVVKKEE